MKKFEKNSKKSNKLANARKINIKKVKIDYKIKKIEKNRKKLKKIDKKRKEEF